MSTRSSSVASLSATVSDLVASQETLSARLTELSRIFSDFARVSGLASEPSTSGAASPLAPISSSSAAPPLAPLPLSGAAPPSAPVPPIGAAPSPAPVPPPSISSAITPSSSNSDSANHLFTSHLVIAAVRALEPFYDPAAPPEDSTLRANSWFPEFIRATLRHAFFHDLSVEAIAPFAVPPISRFISVVANYRLPAPWSALEKASAQIDQVARALLSDLLQHFESFVLSATEFPPFYKLVNDAIHQLRSDCPWIVERRRDKPPTYLLQDGDNPIQPAPSDASSPAASPSKSPSNYRLVSVSTPYKRRPRRQGR